MKHYINILKSRINIDVLFLFLTAIILFMPPFKSYFVSDNLNQIPGIQNNLFLQSYGFMRPLNGLSLYIDKLIWGINPFGFHLMNILLHIASAVLIYYMAGYFLKNRSFKIISSFLFLLHPIHAMNIFWIMGRTDTVCSLFYLSSFLLFLKYFKSNNLKEYYLSLFLFFLAVFSKETAISLPIVIFLYFFIFRFENIKKTFLKSLKIMSPYFLILLFYFFSRVLFFGELNISNPFHSNINPIHLMKNMAAFMGLLVIPGGHISIGNYLMAYPVIFISLAIVSLTGFILIFWIFRKSKTAIFLLLSIIIILFPMIRLMMRWYLYIPSAAFILLLAFIIVEFSKKMKYEKVFKIIITVLIAIIFTFFIRIEKNRWYKCGEFANTLSTQIADKMIEKKIAQCIFLNNISQLEEAPVLIFGLGAMVNFSAFHDYDRIEELKVYNLSDISLEKKEDFNGIIVSKDSINTYTIKIASNISYFEFPMYGELISKKIELKKDHLIKLKLGKIIINEINNQKNAKDITIKLKKDNSIPVMYFSKGQLHIDIHE